MAGIEPDFLWNIAREGILIWGKPGDLLLREPLASLEPLLLISYSLKGLREEKLAPGVILIRGEKLEESGTFREIRSKECSI